MSKRLSTVMAAAVLAYVVFGLAGCGGSSSEVVAQVGGASITKSEVSHWMSTLAGGDYHEVSGGHQVPAGLASEPPNYKACVTRLEAAIANSATAAPKPTDLLTKCRQIYLALKIQAVSFLVKAQRLLALYRDEGITASEQEVLQFFKARRAQYGTEAELHAYLSARRLTLGDLLLLLKLGLLFQKFQSKFGAGSAQVAAKLAKAEQRLTAETNCHPGYVVQYCKQFKGEQNYAGTLPPAVLMEQVTAIVTGRCTNFAACSKL